MTNDNYKTSQSSLIDTAEPELPERPRNVNIALALLVIALAVPGLRALKELQDMHFQVENVGSLAMYCAYFGVLVALILLIARAKGWARLVFLILILIEFARICTAVGIAWRRAPELWNYLLTAQYLLMTVLPVFLNFVALHLLYFSSGNWFRKS